MPAKNTGGKASGGPAGAARSNRMKAAKNQVYNDIAKGRAKAFPGAALPLKRTQKTQGTQRRGPH